MQKEVQEMKNIKIYEKRFIGVTASCAEHSSLSNKSSIVEGNLIERV